MEHIYTARFRKDWNWWEVVETTISGNSIIAIFPGDGEERAKNYVLTLELDESFTR